MAVSASRLTKKYIYNHPTHHELMQWAAWALPNKLTPASSSPIATLMKRAAEQEIEIVSNDDPYDFTFEIEVTDKAVARLRHESDRRLFKLIKKYYLKSMSHWQIAQDFRTGEDVVKMLHWRALSAVMRHTYTVTEALTAKNRRV